jgi:hypothetical protein
MNAYTRSFKLDDNNGIWGHLQRKVKQIKKYFSRS